MDQIDWQAFATMAVIAVLYIPVAIRCAPGAALTCRSIWCRCCRRSSEEGPEEDTDRENKQREADLIRQRLSQIRCKYLTDVVSMWTHVCGAIALLGVFRHLDGALSPDYVLGQPRLDAFQSTVIGVSFITSIAIRMYPCVVNQTTLWMVHSWYMGLILCYGTHTAMMDAGSRFVINQPKLQLLNVIMGLAYPEGVPNFLWNTAWAIMASVTVSQAAAQHHGIEAGGVVSSSCFIVGFLSLVLWKFQQLQMSLVQSELEAKGHLQAKATMGKVLSSMCDAVVELDGQLGIRRPCPKLADLLIKRSNSTALKGEEFPGLIFNDADRERFVDFVTPRMVPLEQQENVEGNEGASSVYLKLRDATGTAVSVQLYHSCHYNPPDDVCHILGVREVQEEHRNVQTAPPQPVTNFTQAPRQSANEESAHEETESVVSAASSGTQCTTEDGSARLAPLIPEGEMLDHVSVLLNPVDMETIACTLGFKAYTGPLAFKGSVREFVGNYSNQFEEWMQEEAHGRLLETTPQKFEIKLRPLTRERPRFEFYADAYIIHAGQEVRASDMGLEPSPNEEEFALLCVLALRNVQTRWLRPSRARQHRTRAVMDGPLPRRYGVSL